MHQNIRAKRKSASHPSLTQLGDSLTRDSLFGILKSAASWLLSFSMVPCMNKARSVLRQHNCCSNLRKFSSARTRRRRTDFCSVTVGWQAALDFSSHSNIPTKFCLCSSSQLALQGTELLMQSSFGSCGWSLGGALMADLGQDRKTEN